ncbi:Zn(2)-Cys(6) zinc finger domain protein [Metarhizium robertsii]|uniref:Zn(2)-Cys(6) zinc finger domain protein n=1 Tax=Metarhizium robertsii TaxID=568076 RepID=A0A014QRH6_9HYPO|nr:Zn(2)-Cys(6) zinc finger domain protein [Metarhizium robertsii]
MERRYVPLRPSSPRDREQDQGHGAGSESLEPKKPRVGVSVACNDCRRRKIRCDGQRPVCSNCQGKTERCEYRDEGGPSKESKDLVVEVLRILGQMPTKEALQYIEGRRGRRGRTDNTIDIKEGLIMPTDRTYATGVADTESHRLSRNSRPGYELVPKRSISAAVSLAMTKNRYYEQRSNPSSLIPDPRSAKLCNDTARYEYEEPHELCDSRLRKLNIRHWTNVDIDDDLAAKCISLYLETDHPLLGHFDAELFVSHLILEQSSDYCTPLLVNSLLYWACQMYSAIDPQTDQIAIRFCTEAESHWTAERHKGNDSILILAATEFLCLGYLGQGRDHVVLRYLTEAADMAGRMGLFNTEGQVSGMETSSYSNLAGAAKTSHMYAAWGIFNWLTLMSLFYHQPGMVCPSSPPRIPIPKRAMLDTSRCGSFRSDTESVPSLPVYMGDTFPYLCRFWTIVREVSWVYHAKGKLPWGSRGSLEFAEFKFRELLAWSNTLPPQLSANQHSQHHHVQVMHLWFHAAVLDIFRPFINDTSHGDRCLTTFNTSSYTPNAICERSTTRLKRLIVNYHLNYTSSSFTILWHTALIYVANAVFNSNKDEDWYSYLLLCLYGYQRLSRSWRLAEAISKGLLSMALRNGDISSHNVTISSASARRILLHFENRSPDRIAGGIRATFMVDLRRALSEPSSSTVEYLADQFEDNLMLREYTTLFDERNIN